jgi:putative transposase
MPHYTALAGGPELSWLKFLDMEAIVRISLRHFSRKYRKQEGGGCPGFRFVVPGSWVAVSFGGFAMPAGLKRYYGRGHLHFITFSCYRRLPLLQSARARDIFVRELGKARDELGFLLIGYVVMPEHVHLLMSEPKSGTPSAVLQKLKLRVARRLRKRKKPVSGGQMELPFAEAGEPLRAFWQARYHDFNVYSEWKRLEKLKYMHGNPVKRGLVRHPKDWPWSSWAFYVRGELGLTRIDVG